MRKLPILLVLAASTSSFPDGLKGNTIFLGCQTGAPAPLTTIVRRFSSVLCYRKMDFLLVHPSRTHAAGCKSKRQVLLGLLLHTNLISRPADSSEPRHRAILTRASVSQRSAIPHTETSDSPKKQFDIFTSGCKNMRRRDREAWVARAGRCYRGSSALPEDSPGQRVLRGCRPWACCVLSFVRPTL